MKAAVLFLNSMFLLMFISGLITEWGNASGIISAIAIVSLVINSVFIMIKTKGEFADLN
ncbi:MAG: putative membrane protein [Gammaproteobacteria bacterium]|jgi:predicted membrane protein